MKFREGIKEKNIIIRCGADKFLPFALTFGLYIILFGTVSPGGGFQGGVIVAGGVLLLYLGHGYNVLKRTVNKEVLRINEAIGATLYVCLGFLGLILGANYCRNVFFDNGAVGDLISAGTISFLGYSVGYKVLTGAGFLLLLMLGMLAPEGEEDTDWDEDYEEDWLDAEETEEAAEAEEEPAAEEADGAEAPEEEAAAAEGGEGGADA